MAFPVRYRAHAAGKKVPSGIIIAWPSTNASIPVGWTRETSLDDRYVKQIATSATNPGATGGATDHNHPYPAHGHTYGHGHAGSWGTSPTGGGTPDDAGGASPSPHTHPSTGTSTNINTTNNGSPTTWNANTTQPAHLTVIFIQSDGTPSGFPVNSLAWFNGTVPPGWSVYGSLDDRFMRGAASGADGGAQAGADLHSHSAAAHTHPIGGTHTHVVSLGGNNTPASHSIAGSIGRAVQGHTHTLGTSVGGSNPANSDSNSETSGTGDQVPPWQKMRAIQKTGSAELTLGAIAMWNGSLATIPPQWKLCDGTLGTPNLSQDKYIRGAATDGEVGNIGGFATHTHPSGSGHAHGSTGTHNHTFTGVSGLSGVQNIGLSEGTGFGSNTHTHPSATYTSPTETIGTSNNIANGATANTSNNPLFTGVAFIQFY